MALGAFNRSGLGAFRRSALGARGGLTNIQGDLFVAGDFTNFNGIATLGVMRYSKSSDAWYTATSGLNTTLDGAVRDFYIHDGYLYCCGQDTTTCCVYKWDQSGLNWSQVGSGTNAIRGAGRKLFSYGGKLCLLCDGNAITTATGTLAPVVTFDDPGWSVLGGAAPFTSGIVSHDNVRVIDGVPYIFGKNRSPFAASSQAGAIAYLNGGAWTLITSQGGTGGTFNAVSHTGPIYLASNEGKQFSINYAQDGANQILDYYNISGEYYLRHSNSAGLPAGERQVEGVLWEWDGTDNAGLQSPFNLIGNMNSTVPGLSNGAEIIETINGITYIGGTFSDFDDVQYSGMIKLSGETVSNITNNRIRNVYTFAQYGATKILIGTQGDLFYGSDPNPSVRNFWEYDTSSESLAAFRGTDAGTSLASSTVRVIFNTQNII